MATTLKIVGTILIALVLIVVIPSDVNSDAVILNIYNTNHNSIMPGITYNNSTIPYVSITISNSQPVSTVKNFQMLINISWREYQNYLNGNCSNVRFYNTTTAIGKSYGFDLLPAWIETNDSPAATLSNVWINMSGTILPASGSTVIYMGFLSKRTSWNSYLGLNPLLANNYGSGDNGANVFLYYDNGKMLMPLKQTGTGGSGPAIIGKAPYNYTITGSVNGGTANSDTWTTNGLSVPALNLPASYIAQIRVYLSGSSALTDLLTNVQNISKGSFYVFRFDARNNGYYDLIGNYPAGATATNILKQSTIQSSTGTWYQMSAVDDNDTLDLYKATYSASNPLLLSNFGNLEVTTAGKGYTGGGIAVTTDGATSTDYWTMIIVRNYPPNGYMPSYSFSTILNAALWHTSLNSYKDQAYTNVTSIWSSGIYCDDKGNLFWTDTYGNVFDAKSIAIYSQVNSTNIYTYTLPESEEFTVGSNNATVNFISLYLSGKGTAEFSIGTSLWGSQILSNTSVTVVTGHLWYNVTIPAILLNGGSDYYLNVYSSSAVQWGYTSNPSSNSFNYLQDYWYRNNRILTHDDIYPNIYTIGYYGFIKSSLGSPYQHFPYAGPITSISAVNYVTSSGLAISELVVLSYYGYAFGLYTNNDTWFNATHQWNLNMATYGAPWTSVTSNVEGYAHGFDEGFLFTNLEGYVYFYDTTNPAHSQWIIDPNNKDYNIISTVAYYRESYGNFFNNSFYGVSYNGEVWVLNQSGWILYDSSPLADVVAITMNGTGYLYLLQFENSTTLFKSSAPAGSSSGTFSAQGNAVFSTGTDEALTYDQSKHVFWAIQTNGTIAGDGNSGGKNWNDEHNQLAPYKYPTILAINSSYIYNFDAYVHYVNSTNYTSMNTFSIYFTGSDSKLNLEYSYLQGMGMNSTHTPALLTSSNGILINLTLEPRMAYNSIFYFYVIFYPRSSPDSIALEYVFDIMVIDHFSYMPMS